ncbi:hypothetical protein JZ751_029368 [Albula glossodonta]|uniref:Uncharacterized protein n=1 Tax=Albula glossodonta TaxID=121402 RepID=A0A8T2PAQ9_9TELE|nr:hypothetical protein JZ751_029368 [Albula glossodonta]
MFCFRCGHASSGNQPCSQRDVRGGENARRKSVYEPLKERCESQSVLVGLDLEKPGKQAQFKS